MSTLPFLFALQSIAIVPADGKYVMSCKPNDAAHATIELNFDGEQMVQSRTTFSDFGCQTAMVKTKWVWGLKYPAEGKVNLEYKSHTFAPLFQYMVDHLNRTAYCGYTDWSVGVEKEMLGRVCNDYKMPVAGDVKYQIFRVDGNTMNLGDDYAPGRDGSSEATRPDSLRDDQVFIHVN
jgi:hypothetical protein